MKCFTHRDVDAIGSCKFCYKGLCSRCFVEGPNGLSCQGACEDKVAVMGNRKATRPPTEKPQPAPVLRPPAAAPAPQPAPRMAAPAPNPIAPVAPRPLQTAPLPMARNNLDPGAMYGAPKLADTPMPDLSSRQVLYLLFQGERYAIDKDEFVIGRSSKGSDLIISNNDISRKHAAIVFLNNKYYIRDCDSVNGIEFNGQRVKSRPIEEGDVYWLASYELRFTYRPV